MEYLNREDKLLVIIGPSAVGKTSVVKELQDREKVIVTPSWTTRPARKDETKRTIEHKFVTQDVFNIKKAKGYFLESVQLFKLPYWYGLPKILNPINKIIPVIMLRINLLTLLDKHYPNYIVYQIEDDFSKIKDRLNNRKKYGQEIGTRIDDYQYEINEGRKVAKRVFKNTTTVNKLADEIDKALLKDFN